MTRRGTRPPRGAFLCGARVGWLRPRATRRMAACSSDLMQGFVDEDLPAIPALQPLVVDNVSDAFPRASAGDRL